MINLMAKLLGLNWVWEKIDGYKVYISGAGAMLSGLGTMFMGAAGIVGEFGAVHDWAAAFAWAKGMGMDANIGLLTKGWLAFMGGLGAVGWRHVQDKAQAAARLAAAPAQPAA